MKGLGDKNKSSCSIYDIVSFAGWEVEAKP